MDLSTALQVALLIIMVIVIFFELWLLRRRKGTRKAYALPRDDDFDDAHNAIVSTEKIMSIMRGQGVETADAESLLREAKRAHSRGDRTYATAKANAARTSLMNAKKYSVCVQPLARPARNFTAEPEPPSEAESLYSGAGDNTVQSPEEIPKDSAPKLPENYLQSKFMISTAEGSVRSATSKGRDVSAADKALMQARAAFAGAEYGKALSLALKAKKLAEGMAAGSGATEGGPAVTDIGAPVSEGVGRWREENPQPKAARARSEQDSLSQDSTALACPECSAVVTLDDAFCRKCGAKLEFQLACPGCGAELDKGDVFCRKCGTKLS